MLNADQSPRLNSLELTDLGLWVHLGCMAEERATPQEVRLTVTLRFHEAPKGCVTDELSETICYAEIAEGLKDHADSREFNLIERLAFASYAIVRKIAGAKAEVQIRVHKVRPPVPTLLGGSSYQCGDF